MSGLERSAERVARDLDVVAGATSTLRAIGERFTGLRTLDAAYDPRHNNFGFLRFALALTVIWSHSYALSGRPSDPVWLLTNQIDGGSLAVDGFFVLSGFLITQSWLQQPVLGAYAWKRLLRLGPALLVASVFGAFMIAPLATTLPFRDYLRTSGPWLHFFGVALNRYLFIPVSFPDNPYPNLLNSPLWSLRYEILCYAAVAVVGLVWGRQQLGKVSLAIFVVSLLIYASLPGWISPLSILSQTPRLFACFAAGMVLFAYKDRVPMRPAWAVVAVLVLGTATLAGGLRVVLPAAGGYLLLYLACRRGFGLENFCRHGDFSYGLYIFACPIQQLLIYQLTPAIAVSTLFVLSAVPALLLAILSWHLVEAPALRHK